MESLLVVYLFGLTLASLLAGGVVIRTWQIGIDRLTRFLIFVGFLWPTAALGSVLVHNDTLALLLYRARWSFVAVGPLLVLLFSLRQSNLDAWTRGGRLFLLSLIPGITVILIWIDSPLLVGRFGVQYVAEARLIYPDELGPWFLVYTPVLYAYLMFTIVRSVSWSEQAMQGYRAQARGFAAVVLVMFAANLFVVVSRRFGMPVMDWTATSFCLSGPLWYWLAREYAAPGLQLVARDTLLDEMDDALVAFDRAGIVIATNRAYDSLRDRIGATPLRELVASMHSGWDGVTPLRRESTITAGQETRCIDASLTPVLHNDRRLATVIVLRDSTEKDRMIRSLEAYDRMVAHDLRNPITSVLSFLDLGSLLLERDPGAARSEHLAARRRCAKALQIVDAHLRLARFRRDRVVTPERVDMQTIVRHVGARLADEIESAGATVSVAPTLPTAVADAELIELVWVNYWTNALRHAGDAPTIRVGADVLSDARVRYWVEDDGPGVTPEDRERVFGGQPTKTATRGHGIGLAIVRQIIEQSGGTVGVDAAASGGARFWFTLPGAAEGRSAATGNSQL